MDNIEISESGLLMMIGVVSTFVLAFFKLTQTSRCNKINCCCIYCEREVISDETFLKMEEHRQEEKKGGEEKKQEVEMTPLRDKK